MKPGLTTRLLHADRLSGPEQGAMHVPMHPSAAFGYKTTSDLVAVFQGDKAGFLYARQGNPTVAALERKIALMDGARGSICFSSGMAAITAVFLTLLRAGDHVVASKYLFGNTFSLLQTLQGIGCAVSLVDATDGAEVEAALQANTRMVFVETIANPRTQVADLDAIGRLCAARGLLYVVDSTLTTPVLFDPRAVQAGLIVHSLTKEIGGHGNALGGAVSDTGLFDWAVYPNIAAPYRKGEAANWGLTQIRKKGLRDAGGALRAEDAHRLSVGADTVVLRVERAAESALRLAHWLEQQPQVRRVYYPGLASHEQHARASRLFSGYGTLLSLELADGIDPFVFLDALKLVVLSTHLGDARTLALPVAHTIFWEMGAQGRAAMGIADGLIRVSIGLEDYEDLEADFAQALKG